MSSFAMIDHYSHINLAGMGHGDRHEMRSHLCHWFHEHPALGWTIFGIMFLIGVTLFFLAVRSVAATPQLTNLDVVLWVAVLLCFPFFGSLSWLIFVSKRYKNPTFTEVIVPLG